MAAFPLSLRFDGEEKGIAATATRESAPMFRGIPEHTPLRVGPKHWPERKQGEGFSRLLPRGSHTWTICAWKELLTNICLQKSKLDSKTCFPYSSGDGGRGSVPTAVTRHQVSAIPSGMGPHWTSVTLWGHYHCHLHSKVLSVPQSLSRLTQEYPAPLASALSTPNWTSTFRGNAANSQEFLRGQSFFPHVPCGSSNIQAHIAPVSPTLF